MPKVETGLPSPLSSSELDGAGSLPPLFDAVSLQIDMFTGEGLDTRTRTQKRRARQRKLPQQLPIFTAAEIMDQARSRFTHPFMLTRGGKPLTLALMIEDPRSEEEVEADRMRLAQEQTYPMEEATRERTEIFNHPKAAPTTGERIASCYGQYDDLKHQFPQAIVFFRLGDFYETFNEDAEIAARELGIVLTSRLVGDFRVPMAGVPHHAVENYIACLIEKGYHVAVCERADEEQGDRPPPQEEVQVVTFGGTDQ